jgi:ribonucleoside-diphosphate reductase alpha chain
MSPISHVVKRTGRRVLFNEHRITQAIFAAMEDVGEGTEKEAEKAKDLVVRKLERDFKEKTPSVEDIQDCVEEALIELRHSAVAKGYILYRNDQARLREQKAALMGGKIDDVDISLNGLKILEQRYLVRDEQGRIKEAPSELFWRVANHVGSASLKYSEDPKAAARTFYRLMSSLEFLPSSPTLMNAGTRRQLSPCYAVPVPDDIDGIFTALHQAALIQKNGGGTGFSFSRLRPKGDTAESVTGTAAGPIAYMRVFEAGMRAVKQSGRRAGANMGVLRVDHPDILDFINIKLTRTMENFNLSVAITDAFMRALEGGGDFELINPRTKKAMGTLSARVVFDSILAVAWRCGDPGLVFIDRMNAANPCRHIAEIETTSPCGEQPLLPNESGMEGSINLVACLKEADGGFEFDRAKLRRIARTAVHFLDGAIDVNNYPTRQAEAAAKGTRRIGLGIMGFADVLFALRIPYDSARAEAFAEDLIEEVAQEARIASTELAKERGVFGYYRGSEHERAGRQIRNSVITAISPTGTTSLIAGVSSGIEPNYALASTRTVVGGSELIHINPFLEAAVEDKEALRAIAKRGMIAGGDAVSDETRAVFKTAQQIAPEWHIRIQAAFQKHVDGAISKTINFPAGASVQEIGAGYLLAWKLGCKGITVYRDSSLDTQVITAGNA